METGQYASVEHDGFTVTSNSETPDQIRESLGTSKDEETSKAAAALGKKGGEAAAKARVESKDTPPERKAVKPIKDKAPAKAEEPEADEKAEAKAGDDEKPEEKPEEQERKLTSREKHAPEYRKAAIAKEIRDLISERDAVRAEVERSRSERRTEPEPKPAERAVAQADDDEPREEDFEKYGDFVKATIEHKAAKIADARIQTVLQKMSAYDRQQRADAAHNANVEAWGKALEGAEAEDPDFGAKISDDVYGLPWGGPKVGEKPTVQHFIAQAILGKPESSAQVMLYLSEHPEELRRLSTLHPAEASWELGRIVGSASAATAGKTAPRTEPRVSRASAPVPPVTGSPLTADRDITDIADFDQFAKVRTAQLKAKRA